MEIRDDNRVSDREMKKVLGGVGTSGNDGIKVPYTCRKCERTFEFVLGSPEAVCTHCGEIHVISG